MRHLQSTKKTAWIPSIKSGILETIIVAGLILKLSSLIKWADKFVINIMR